MLNRKCGRGGFSARLNSELAQSNCPFMLFMGVLLALCGIIVRFYVGGPHLTILALHLESILPPIWLMCVLWTVSFFTIGCAAGFVLAYRGGCEVEKYKGCMIFVLMVVLELCWYPTFFGIGAIFLSVLESIAIFALSVGVLRCFLRVSTFAGGLMIFHTLWLLYILVLNFAAFFKG